MASLTVFLILAIIAFSLGVGVHELSPEEKQEIMNEVNRLKKETMKKREELYGGSSSEHFKPIEWDDRLASTAQEVANRLKWGEETIPHDERFDVSKYSGNLNLTDHNKIHGLRDWIHDAYKGESEQTRRERNIESHEELLKHYEMSVEGQYMGCAAYAHHYHPDLPLYLVCQFSRKREQPTEASHSSATKP